VFATLLLRDQLWDQWDTGAHLFRNIVQATCFLNQKNVSIEAGHSLFQEDADLSAIYFTIACFQWSIGTIVFNLISGIARHGEILPET
jgi:hypothetical protein